MIFRKGQLIVTPISRPKISIVVSLGLALASWPSWPPGRFALWLLGYCTLPHPSACEVVFSQNEIQ